MIENFLNSFLEANIIQLILLSVFAFLFILRMCFNLFFSLRVLKSGKKIPQGNITPFSVLLTVRNEEENIRKNLPGILRIENCEFEVVAIDDFSQDNSLPVLGVLRKENEKLKVSSLNQETRFSMKLSQNIAIKAAKYDWVIIIPPSISEYNSEWLKQIAGAVSSNVSVVAGYSNISIKKSFINRLYRIERFLLQIKSAGYTLNGLPFIYFEDNVAFNKNKYFELGGYGKKINEPYVNLELLINIFMKKKQTSLLYKNETSLRKEEDVLPVDYFNLLKKSIRVEKHLSWMKRFMIQFDNFSDLLFLPFMVLVVILFFKVWPLILALTVILSLTHLFIIKTLQNRLNERKIFLSSLMYELIGPYFKLVYKWHFNRLSRHQKWRSSF